MSLFPSFRLVVVSALVAVTGCSGLPKKVVTPEAETLSPRQVVGEIAVSPSIPMPRIETANKVAKIDVKERVKGFACSGGELRAEFPRDLYFLKSEGLDLSTAEGQAKAGAAFDALFGDLRDSKGSSSEVAPFYSDDILIAPSYLVQTRRTSPFSTEICVKVVGYRGVVTGFEDSTIRRSSDGREINPSKPLSPDGVEGKFSITVF